MEMKWLKAVVLTAAAIMASIVDGNLVMKVENKFKMISRERKVNLTELKAHDDLRRGRFLSAVDIPMGGNGYPTDAGLYYGQIGLGNPSRNYYVQMDTGSDTFWVNCAGCVNCPTKTDLNIHLSFYDPSKSTTSKDVKCDDDYCTTQNNGDLPNCRNGQRCRFNVEYGDSSSTFGYFVNDYVQLEQVTGNLKTTKLDANIVFGCADRVTGDSDSNAVDGILGFGAANSSVLSQIAAAGKVKKVFSHCLDDDSGGGIFAIGEVVSPKVTTTPLLPNKPHYNVDLLRIDVGGEPLSVQTNGDQRETIIDSGTTLAVLPSDIYNAFVSKMIAPHPGLQLTTYHGLHCFHFSQNIDDGFPTVKFYFDNSLNLTVYPREYLFEIDKDMWCIGWQNGGQQSHNVQQLIILGDLVLSNKLVVYNLEDQTIGWTDYNCSSSIKIKDEKSGAVYTVGAHNISLALSLTVGTYLFWISVLLAILQIL